MATYSPNEIAALIYLVGNWGPGSKKKAPAFLDVAIAVCLAESGGNEFSFNPPSGGAKYAVGLWQIMYPDHRDLLDKYAAQYGVGGGAKSYTHPLVNTSTARDLQTSQGWAPWEVYTNGAYKRHLGHGAAAYAWISDKNNMTAFKARMSNYGINVSSNVAPDQSWQDILKGFPDYMTKRLKEMGISIGIFLVGAVLLILGVWFLLSQNAGAIAKYTPQGAALKGVSDTIGKPQFRGKGGSRFAKETATK